jgi:Mg2+/Co2+ transporter CorB
MAASVATVIGLRFFGDSGVVITPIVLTIFFLIFAEVAPKTLAAQTPERIAFPASHVLTPLLRVMYPLVFSINAVANTLVKPFLSRAKRESDSLSVEELKTVVNEGAGLGSQDQSMLISILDLQNVTVNDIMVPRNEIVGIDIDDEIVEILNVLANSQHTRLPVYKENINNIIGMLHLRRVARHLPRQSGTEQLSRADIMQLTEDPYYVPEATQLPTQLLNFKKEKKRIALIVDEYGDVQGIVTLEDILEEIVGEFTTDFAAKVSEIHPQQDGSYLIDGMALVRDINRVLDWDLPTEGPKTLSGLVLEHLETIPENNLCLRVDDYLIETLQIKDNVIKNLKITRATAGS